MSTAGFTYRKTLFCNKTDQASLQCDLHYPNDERENVTFLAQLCQQTGRYDEMAINMKEITKFGGELSVEERDLLFEAYTHVITTRRTSWRIISSIKRKEESRGSRKHISAIHCYLQKIEAELECICQDILDVLDNSLIPKAESDESKVFYHKMKGDYRRYLAEFALGEERKVATTAAYEAYQAATDVAHDKLNPTHPIRLILALNFSVFYYDIMNLPGPACHLAKQAFDDAFVELDSVPTESYCNCALIMQLLRDNLRRWRSSNGADEFSDEPRKGPEPKDDVSATVA